VKRVQKKLAVLIGASAFTAIATLALSYVLLPRMGINGAGIAILGSHGIVAVAIVVNSLGKRPAVRESLGKLRISLWRKK